ncbi:hypothetical protein J3A66_003431 [Sphingomonas sp. PvP018]|nr:hypothetical protein [Sphingomonas sp. PvP018]
MHRSRSSLASPNWAPAYAGVVRSLEWRGAEGAILHRFLFSRAGGSPVSIPAFAGKQFWGALVPAASC